MADTRTKNQSYAPHFSAGRGGHDKPWRPPRGWHSSQFAYQIQREPHLHLHWLHPGGRQSLPNPSHLYCRTNQVVQREENR